MVRRLPYGMSLILGMVFWMGCTASSQAAEKQNQEKEREVTIKQVPAPVRATILKQAGKNKIEEIVEVTRDNKTLFEVTWMKEGKEVEIRLTPAGELLGAEAKKAKEKKEMKEREDDEDEKEADEKDEDEDEKETDQKKAKHQEKDRKEQKQKQGQAKAETERKVTQEQVPAAALAALKKMAGGASFKEFAEETEQGQTFYEGSWTAPSGKNMDVLVTPRGDLVEIEEQLEAGQVPAAATAAARKAAGKDTEVTFEKKTMVLYEAKFRKGDVSLELLLTPDGRVVEKTAEKASAATEPETPAEKKAEAAQLPTPVMKTFKAKFPKGQVFKTDAELENGVMVYDLEFKDGATEKETDITADGTMLEFTVVIDAKAVPPAAMKAVQEAAAGAALKRIERVEISFETKGGKTVKLPKPVTHFAVEVVKGDRTTEVVVTADGKVVEEPNWGGGEKQ